MGDLVLRDELCRALEARRELGPDSENEIAEALRAKLEQRLAEPDVIAVVGAHFT